MADINKIRVGDKTPTRIMRDNHTVNADGTYDLSSVEIWDVKKGNTSIYHKNKTPENCWVKYGIAKKETLDSGNICYKITSENVTEGKLIVPPIDDFINTIENIGAVIKWNTAIANHAYWNDNDALIHYYNNAIFDVNDTHRMFTRSNILYNDSGVPLVLVGTGSLFRLANYSAIKKFTILSQADIEDASYAFLNTTNLNTLEWIGNPIKGKNVSYMFNGTGLTTYPGNLIDWSIKTENLYSSPCNLMGSFSGTNGDTIGQLEIIPYYNDGTEDKTDVMITPESEHNYALFSEKIKVIKPIIDCSLIGGYSNATDFLFNYPQLISCKLKNLNHVNWHFEQTVNLDQESITYLFNNLTDLTTHNSNLPITREWNNCFSICNGNIWTINENKCIRHYDKITNCKQSDLSENNSDEPIFVLNKSIVAELKLTFESDDMDGGCFILSTYPFDYNTATPIADGDLVVNDENWPYSTFAIWYTSMNNVDTDITKNTIKFTYPSSQTNPKNSSANLYCPTEWNSKITNEMVENAMAKGWTTYINGTVHPYLNGRSDGGGGVN